MDDERIFGEGPIKVVAESDSIKFELPTDDGRHFFLRFPASEGLRIIEDMRKALYVIAALKEDENL